MNHINSSYGNHAAIPSLAERQAWRHALTTKSLHTKHQKHLAAPQRKRAEPPRFRSAFEILRQLDLFSPVSDGELLKFANLGRERRVERDTAMMSGLKRAEAPLALILEGDALLAWGRGPEELFLRALEPGDLVGECDLFEALSSGVMLGLQGGLRTSVSGGEYNEPAAVGRVREAVPRYEMERAGYGETSARAVTTVRLIEWDRDAVREALRRWPDVALSFLYGMARRQRDMHRRIAGLCRQRAPRRLARALAALLEERGVAHRDEAGRAALLLPRTPSRTRIAGIAGMARETVSRLLADWERRGWIAARQGDLLVFDRRALLRLAGGELS